MKIIWDIYLQVVHKEPFYYGHFLLCPMWPLWRGSTVDFAILKVDTNSQGVFTWENSHWREFHTGMTVWFRIAFTWWLAHFISRYLKVHVMLIKYMCDSKSQTYRMCYLFQSTSRLISHRNVWSFRVYMMLLWDLDPEWISYPGTTTRVNSRLGDSRRHDIFWGYHVNKCRAMRGNRSELTLAWKLSPVSCKHPLRHSCYTCNINHTGTSCLNIGLGYPSFESLFIGKVTMEITNN